MFSTFDCSDAKTYGGWRVNWEAAGNLPKCGLNLTYPKFEKIVWEKTYHNDSELVEVNIKEILDSFKAGGYDLDAWKYYQGRIKLAENSSKNPFHYPIVEIDGYNKYQLGEGRHRLNILRTVYGIETIKAELYRKR